MEHDPTSVRLGREPVRNDSCESRYLGISTHRHSKNQPVRKSGSGASADNSLRSAAEALKGTLVSGGKRLEIRHFCFAACGSSIRQEVFAGPISLDAPELEAMTLVVDPSIPDTALRRAVFTQFPRDSLVQTLADIGQLVRPPDDVFYQSLDQQYGRVRRFLPALLGHIHFAAGHADTPLLDALDYLRLQEDSPAPLSAPLSVVPPKWRRHVGDVQSRSQQRAYTFCVLDRLRKALHRREVFVSPSCRYADPRSGLLEGAQWQATRGMICRTLALPAIPEPAIAALSEELDQTYRAAIERLPENPAVRFEKVGDRNELVL